MPGIFSRNSRVSATNAVNDKHLAKNYAREIWVIGADLKAARLDYKLKVVRNSPQSVLNRVTDDFRKVVLRWPYYDGTPQNRRVYPDSEGRYPENAQPYPSKNIISKYIGMAARAKIIKVALLARLGVEDERQRFEGLLPTINAMADVNEFMRSIKKYLNRIVAPHPPEYPNSEDYDDDYDAPPPPARNAPVYARTANQPYAVTPPSPQPSRLIGEQPPEYHAGNGRRKTRRVRRRKARKTRKH